MGLFGGEKVGGDRVLRESLAAGFNLKDYQDGRDFVGACASGPSYQ